MTMHEPAGRFITAQSWWIASELARRHPELLVIETHRVDGMASCLSLVDPDGPIDLGQLNRAGSLHAGGTTAVATWHEALSADDSHEVVKRLERTAGLQAPPSAPATTGRTLTYRILARVLAAVVDDRRAWDARNGRLDTSECAPEDRPELQSFPSVVEGLRNRRPDDLHGIPAYRFWILHRDEEPVAVLDTDGRLHQRERPPEDLMPVYRAAGGRLIATIGAAMGHVLP